MTRRRIVFLTALGFVALGLYLARSQILPAVACFLDVGEQPRRVECVMALPGDSERRPWVAAAMIKAELAERALIPTNAETLDVADGIEPPSFEITRRIYQSRGIANERIIVLRGATRSTADDLELLAGYLAGTPKVTAAVVTSRFHTRRTCWHIRRGLPEHADRITVISAPNPGFAAETWWLNGEGFRHVLMEYMKLAYYWLRYGDGVYWMGGFVAAGLGFGIWRMGRGGGSTG